MELFEARSLMLQPKKRRKERGAVDVVVVVGPLASVAPVSWTLAPRRFILGPPQVYL